MTWRANSKKRGSNGEKCGGLCIENFQWKFFISWASQFRRIRPPWPVWWRKCQEKNAWLMMTMFCSESSRRYAINSRTRCSRAFEPSFCWGIASFSKYKLFSIFICSLTWSHNVIFFVLMFEFRYVSIALLSGDIMTKSHTWLSWDASCNPAVVRRGSLIEWFPMLWNPCPCRMIVIVLLVMCYEINKSLCDPT